MFLSGGIDSSAIAAVMSQLVKEPIKTFSVAFAEREANEWEYARAVANAYRTEHSQIVVSPAEFSLRCPRLFIRKTNRWRTSSVPLYVVSKLAREHVKVVLTGVGADELLAGYNKYRATIFNLQLGAYYNPLRLARVRDAIRHQVEKLGARTACGRNYSAHSVSACRAAQHLLRQTLHLLTRHAAGVVHRADLRRYTGR
jgi:asparagine synthase (glutamine-hydrolysing)